MYVPQVLSYCLIMVHLQKTEAKRTGLNLEHHETLLAPREFCLGLNYGLKFIWHPLIEIHELPHFLFTHTPLNSSNVKAKALHCFYQKNLNTSIVGLEFITLSQRPYLPAWLKGLHILSQPNLL